MVSNADPSEIAHFSELADEWWNPEGKLYTLHDINPTRLEYINKQTPLSRKTVLDVGCGGGILAESMLKLGADVTGIDLCESALTAARTHQKDNEKKVNYIHISAEQMAEKNPGRFDVVTCLEMLEHIPDPAATVAACAKLVKPGGDLFFSTLNRTMRAWLFAILGAEYILRIIPKNTHDYSRFIQPATLSAWLRQAGLQVKQMTGMHYNPFTRKTTLNPDVSVNYIIHAGKT